MSKKSDWQRAIFYSFTGTALCAAVSFYSFLGSLTPLQGPPGIKASPFESLQPRAAPLAPTPTAAKPVSAAPEVSLHTPVTSAGTTSPLPSSRPQYKYTALLSPSGPLYSNQPFLSRIAAAAAWQSFTNTNAAPVIAVVDTGFALNHDDLKNRWLLNTAETSSGGTDSDANGYVDDWRGWDFVGNNNNPLAGKMNPGGSSVSHGTLTAGLASLLNPNATIMPLQALDDNGIGYTDQVAAAVRYAADNGATIISLSLGTTADDPYLKAQIDYAINKGVLVIAAAGNDGCSCLLYPAAYPKVIAVGASDASNNRAAFSSYGPNLDVVAPGTAGDVCSTFFSAANPTSAYSCGWSGTSLAAPIVSGLAALILQQHPMANANDATTLIIRATQKLAGMGTASRTDTFGYGLIQAEQSVGLATIPLPLGQFLNKTTASLTGATLASGPIMNSTCSGIPGASCELRLSGPAGQNILIGTKILDDYGGAEFPWSAASLGLTPGQWTVVATTQIFGQTKTSSLQLTMSP